jgi:hypothetical protein
VVGRFREDIDGEQHREGDGRYGHKLEEARSGVLDIGQPRRLDDMAAAAGKAHHLGDGESGEQGDERAEHHGRFYRADQGESLGNGLWRRGRRQPQ